MVQHRFPQPDSRLHRRRHHQNRLEEVPSTRIYLELNLPFPPMPSWSPLASLSKPHLTSSVLQNSNTIGRAAEGTNLRSRSRNYSGDRLPVHIRLSYPPTSFCV